MSSTPPFRLEHLDHVVLRTADPRRLQRFYEQLGATVERDRLEEIGLLQLRFGRSMLDLVRAAEAVDNLNGNLDHFAVRVAPFDAEAIAQYCRAMGIPCEVPDFLLMGAEGMGPAAYVTDPDGNRLELKGPASTAA